MDRRAFPRSLIMAALLIVTGCSNSKPPPVIETPDAATSDASPPQDSGRPPTDANPAQDTGPAVDAGCAAGQTSCNGTCTSTTTDNSNCGKCGTVCSSGQACTAGTCQLQCPAEFSNCSGICVNETNDNHNCGSCSTTCPSGQVCNGQGACQVTCAPGVTDCSGICSNTNSDNSNCGGCGKACPSGQICSGAGVCKVTCVSGEVTCGGACTNTLTDNANCGACGKACASGQVCNGSGVCATTCATGETDCSGRCSNLRLDNLNCGTCGNACGSGAVCNGLGACAVSCVAGQTDCAGLCSNTNTDTLNCGACGNACPSGQVCNGSGTCAPSCNPGQTVCEGACTNLLNDPANCGSCATQDAGAVCGSTQACSVGACVQLASVCDVGGIYEPSGTVNPTNSCQNCQPLNNSNGWSSVTGGTPCGDAGGSCGAGACVLPDAGPGPGADAGRDGGSAPDSGPGIDSGSGVDSGHGVDAGTDAPPATCGVPGKPCCESTVDGAVVSTCVSGSTCGGSECGCISGYATSVGNGTPYVIQRSDGTLWQQSTSSGPFTSIVDGNGSPLRPTSFSVGPYHGCAVVNGGVLCFPVGASTSTVSVLSALGANITSGAISSAVQVVTSSSPSAPLLTGIRSVAVGGATSCAITTGGGVWCWGGGPDGSAGQSVATSYPYAAQVLLSDGVTALSGVTQIAMTYASTSNYTAVCALKTDNSVWCWGDNYSAYETSPSATAGTIALHPTQVLPVPGGYGATWIAGSDAWGTFCAVITDQSVECWGSNQNSVAGQFTGASTPPNTVYADDAGTPFLGAVDLSLGEYDSCARKADGTVWCWGEAYGAIPVPALSLSVPVSTNFPLSTSGVWLTYLDENDELEVRNSGTPITTTAFCSLPLPAYAAADAGGVDAGSASCATSCGTNHVCVNGACEPCGTQGEVCCGGSTCGSSLTCTSQGLCECGLAGEACCGGAACNGAHLTCADAGGTPTCTCGGIGQACCGSTTDAGVTLTCAGGEVCGGIECGCVTAYAASPGGNTPYVVQRTDGTLWQSASGLTGFTNIVDENGVPLLPTSFSVGPYHGCAVVSGGGVLCFPTGASTPAVSSGYGAYVLAALGANITTGLVSSAVQVVTSNTPSAPLLTNIRAVYVGAVTSCAIDNGGAVWCWGGGTDGSSGQGAPLSSPYASKVLLSDGVTALSGVTTLAFTYASWANNTAVCALKTDHSVWCWGDNSSADETSVGAAASSVALRPTQILPHLGGPGAASIVGSPGLSGTFCSIMTDSTTECWGSNSYSVAGQPASGSFEPSTVYATDAGAPLLGAIDLTMGTYDSCARKADGTVWCWGLSYGPTPMQAENSSDILVTTNFPLSTSSSYLTYIDNNDQLSVRNNGTEITSSALCSLPTASYSALTDGGVFDAGSTTCTPTCGTGRTCVNGECTPCGTQGALCCGSSSCEADLTCTTSGFCECGLLGEACCGGTACNGAHLTCVDAGSAASPTCACGGLGEACCANETGVGVTLSCASGGECGGYACGCITGYATANGGGGYLVQRTDTTLWQQDTTSSSGGTFAKVLNPLGNALTGATSFSIGPYHGCAVVGGNVYCFPLAAVSSTTNPLAIPALGGNLTGPGPYTATVEVVKSDTTFLSSVVSVAVGGVTSCAIDINGAVWCWGDGTDGSTGHGVAAQYPYAVPVLVASGGAQFGSAKQLAVAYSYVVGNTAVCALKTDNSIWCWGYNNAAGETSVGAAASSTALYPVELMAGGADAGAMSVAGSQDSWGTFCAIMSNSTVQCWGSNTYNVAGQATGVGPAPGTVYESAGVAFTGAMTLSMGEYDSCATKGDGTVWCWGLTYGVNPTQAENYSSVLITTNFPLSTSGVYLTYLDNNDQLNMRNSGATVTTLGLCSQP